MPPIQCDWISGGFFWGGLQLGKKMTYRSCKNPKIHAAVVAADLTWHYVKRFNRYGYIFKSLCACWVLLAAQQKVAMVDYFGSYYVQRKLYFLCSLNGSQFFSFSSFSFLFLPCPPKYVLVFALYKKLDHALKTNSYIVSKSSQSMEKSIKIKFLTSSSCSFP